ncbi:MAG: alpha,alpha-trehalose-phosphate synthase [Thiomonas sp. 13-66-29]|jgi:hydroxymethylpyrimidine pyrophosphatase-like HAD family hydrolase|nr:MAG: alpha,alpha-trehalose-phosphate synthase [Thiomonas sp. 15-66-11]OZB57893.1 MAG: alpha,alpha-trehalose-phosphate synthase [Thiomonas sp. 13-66-29]
MLFTILATDLDGTFLGGSPTQRSELVLVFVCGRGQAFMQQLATVLPVRPDHLIGDVGTSVSSGPQYAPLPPLERWLDAAWPADAAARIERQMQAHPQLRPQAVLSGRRRSYLFDNPAQTHAARHAMHGVGFDTLLSDNQYFDVLPRGVQKGPTLLRTLMALGLPAQRTLVLNDLSMFETGLAGVAVGNREAELDAAIAHHRNVYRSPHPGAAAVLDALRRFHQRGNFHGFITGHRLSQATL